MTRLSSLLGAAAIELERCKLMIANEEQSWKYQNDAALVFMIACFSDES
jgi:hypothetical protein